MQRTAKVRAVTAVLGRSSPSKTVSLKNVSGDDIKFLVEQGAFEGRRLFYNGRTGVLKIEGNMANFTHEALSKFLYHIFHEAMVEDGFITSEELANKVRASAEFKGFLKYEVNAHFYHFNQAYANSLRTPDYALVNDRFEGFDLTTCNMPVVVGEAGASQTYSQLIDRVRLWLFGSEMTRLVILLKFWDIRNIRNDNEGLESSVLVFPATQVQGSECLENATDLDYPLARTGYDEDRCTSHARLAANTARQCYSEYAASIATTSWPTVSLRAEVWRRCRPAANGDLRVTRDELKYLIIRGRKVTTDTSIKIYEDDFRDSDNPNAFYSVNWDHLLDDLPTAWIADGLQTVPTPQLPRAVPLRRGHFRDHFSRFAPY